MFEVDTGGIAVPGELYRLAEGVDQDISAYGGWRAYIAADTMLT